ncbi:MAG TPA: hypothetical protein PLR99_24660, partial [Polyangiaceae bacterium]|nr:hypothetical protein [Polyangiaceae bacterium]
MAPPVTERARASTPSTPRTGLRWAALTGALASLAAACGAPQTPGANAPKAERSDSIAAAAAAQGGLPS